MKLHHPALSLLCAAVLSGCSLAPVYERPAAPVAPAYPAGPAYAAPQSGTAAADLGWRDFLVDARLQRLIDLGLKNNPDLRVAMLNVERVRAQYALQRSSQLPQLSADVSGDRSRSSTSNGWPVDRQQRFRRPDRRRGNSISSGACATSPRRRNSLTWRRRMRARPRKSCWCRKSPTSI